MDKITYYLSRVSMDWKCPRARYWAYEYNGKGLTSDVTHLELYLGQILHDGLAGIARGIDLESIVDAGTKQLRETLLANTIGEPEAEYFAHEQCALIEGLLRGFSKIVWPILQKRFPKVVLIEKEVQYEHAGLTFIARPDLIVADPEENLWYLEYKSSSSNKDTWINSWSTAVQLHSSVRAVEATLGEKVTGIIVQGLYKGYVSYGRQSSPFCYSYYKAGNPPFTKDDLLYEYKAGYKRVPTWEREGGVKAWVEQMPEELLMQQFPQVPPIFLNEDLIDAFFRQRAEREQKIASISKQILDEPDSKQALLDVGFPQRFDQCQPGWGKPCMFKNLCFGRKDVNPLEMGYIYREPHIQQETPSDT